jgi:hypothetical protein
MFKGFAKDVAENAGWWGCVVGALVCFTAGATAGGCVLLGLSVWMW